MSYYKYINKPESLNNLYFGNGSDDIQSFGVDFAPSYFYQLFEEKEKTMCNCEECKNLIKDLREDIEWLSDRQEKLEIITEADKYEKKYIKKL